MAGAVAGIIAITIVPVFILIVRIIILTFIIWTLYVGFIDLEILIIVGDVNFVDLIHHSCIYGLLGEDAGSIFIAFSKAACRDSGKSWLNLSSISSPNLLYSELAYWIHCVLDPASSIVMPGYANRKCVILAVICLQGFVWFLLDRIESMKSL